MTGFFVLFPLILKAIFISCFLTTTYLQGQQSTVSNCPSKAALSKYYPYRSLHSMYPGHQWRHQRLSLPPYRLSLNLLGSHNEIRSSLRPSPSGWGLCIEDLCIVLLLLNRLSQHLLCDQDHQKFQLDICSNRPSCFKANSAAP